MRTTGRRAWLLMGLGFISIPLVAAALAHACTGLATVNVAPGSAAAGSTVAVTGKYFTAHDPADSRTGQLAEIRLDEVDGPVLATAAPTGADRSFTVPVRLPQVGPGTHVMIVTQNTAAGTPSYGTPARKAFTVTAPPPSRAVSNGPGATGPPATTVPESQPAVLTLATARRLARKRIKSANPRAKRIRASCARRSKTSAVCRTRFKVGSRAIQKRVVVRMAQSSSPFGW